jgi:nucleoside-diphosphate-sugar epimerase
MPESSVSFSKVLVTGAPGWLCDALLPALRAGPIRCLLQTGLAPQKVDAWRAGHPEVAEVRGGDLADGGSLEAACIGLEGGAVLHGAGVIHPKRTRDWYRINRDGTLKLARAAKSAGARRFVFVSSNAAQGAADDPAALLDEAMPCKPLSHYGRSKFEAEQALLSLHDAGRFDIVIARPCMFYGPPVPARHIDIYRRIVHGRLPLVGGGCYARSLSYIDDLVAGVNLCLTHGAAAGEIFNLCDERVYTTLEVCEAMAAALGVTPRYLRIPGFSASVAYGIDCTFAAAGFYSMNFHLLGEANWNVGCSNRKAVERLGYRTTVDVFEGYRRAIAWCREKGLLDGVLKNPG